MVYYVCYVNQCKNLILNKILTNFFFPHPFKNIYEQVYFSIVLGSFIIAKKKKGLSYKL